MKVAFCIPGYSTDAERLQPWLTIEKVRSALIDVGWEVHLLSDVDERSDVGSLRCKYVRTFRPSNSAEVGAALRAVRPDRVVASVTPLSLISSGWYKSTGCEFIAFVSYPFYTVAELARAFPRLRGSDFVTYGRHALVPTSVWAATLRRHFSAVIAQSERTAQRVAGAGGPDLVAHCLRAGLDRDFWTPLEGGTAQRLPERFRFLYVGSTKAIRGFDLLLDAFRRISAGDVELRVLARGSAVTEVSALRRRIAAHVGAGRDRVEVIGGWMDRERYRDEVRAADVAVLPFVLVPSELPVSVLECIACGTPVIASDIDGLPEAVGPAGVIVRSGSAQALAVAMAELVGDSSRLDELRKHCLEVREGMLTWPEVGREWARVLSL